MEPMGTVWLVNTEQVAPQAVLMKGSFSDLQQPYLKDHGM